MFVLYLTVKLSIEPGRIAPVFSDFVVWIRLVWLYLFRFTAPVDTIDQLAGPFNARDVVQLYLAHGFAGSAHLLAIAHFVQDYARAHVRTFKLGYEHQRTRKYAVHAKRHVVGQKHSFLQAGGRDARVRLESHREATHYGLSLVHPLPHFFFQRFDALHILLQKFSGIAVLNLIILFGRFLNLVTKHLSFQTSIERVVIFFE